MKPAAPSIVDFRRLPVGEDKQIQVKLDDLAREGARMMIATALEAEVAEYIERFAEERDEDGKRLVVRTAWPASAGHVHHVLATDDQERPKHQLGDARLHSQRRSAPLVREMTAAVSSTLSLAVRANQIRRQWPQTRPSAMTRPPGCEHLARPPRPPRSADHSQAAGDNTP